ncbi:hypothetical protein F4778DRAFT_528627 [Xylariomycetidae sp. FL2044]|nr:hypothetical protein F4778DRAFT_528627 [Xylariomycetidae sp. FL2044]
MAMMTGTQRNGVIAKKRVTVGKRRDIVGFESAFVEGESPVSPVMRITRRVVLGIQHLLLYSLVLVLGLTCHYRKVKNKWDRALLRAVLIEASDGGRSLLAPWCEQHGKFTQLVAFRQRMWTVYRLGLRKEADIHPGSDFGVAFVANVVCLRPVRET